MKYTKTYLKNLKTPEWYSYYGSWDDLFFFWKEEYWKWFLVSGVLEEDIENRSYYTIIDKWYTREGATLDKNL